MKNKKNASENPFEDGLLDREKSSLIENKKSETIASFKNIN